MKSIKKYVQSFKMGIQEVIEYRYDFLLGIFSAIFPIIIQYYLWTAVFNNSDRKIIYGYTYYQMIIYTLLAGLISKLISCGFEYDIYKDIKTGNMSKFIIQPIDYFRYRICCFLGRKIIQAGIMMIIISGMLILAINVYGLNLTMERILFFILSVVLATILNMLISFSVSTIAFWFIEISYLFSLISMVVNLVSGGVLPLEVFGSTMNKLFILLPFRYTVYYPINIINGKLGFEAIVKGLVIQCLWILLMYIIAKASWRRGMRKYIAVGG